MEDHALEPSSRRRVSKKPSSLGAAEDLPPPAFPVVGVGASAGGLEAFTELLRHLPADTDMAFVLVQHLDPTHASLLVELLASKTSMSLVEARDGMPVTPNAVYVVPPAKDMVIEQATLRLTPRLTAGMHLPIDSFLQSLARDRGSAAVAV
ncbi:MAG TPA: chemotaxis protein CheB, partial [Thermoleophilia bacterium]|nr:chemotaxis protein CheB [Thermoleophilia bacterium]